MALPAASRNKLYGLDHLRALAIIMVFLFHYGRLFPHPEWIESISRFGWTGVDLFFVLSGYLIASQLFLNIATNGKFSLKEFFVKRFFRIIPGYLFVLALYYYFPFVREREGLAPLWKYLTFTQNIALDLRTQGTFSHAWSLCIEEQFYICLPFILWGGISFKVFPKSFWIIPVLFVLGFVLRYSIYQYAIEPLKQINEGWAVFWYKWIYYPTWCRLDGLLVGVGIAALFQFKPRIREGITKHGNTFLLLSLVMLIAAYFICYDTSSFQASVFGFPLVSVGYGLLVIGAISPTSVLYKCNSNLTMFMATISYAMYLSHKMVIHVVQELLFNGGIDMESNTAFGVSLTLSIGIAVLMHQMIEGPFQKLRNKIL